MTSLLVRSATPYPWPFDGRADPEATALVVVASRGGISKTCQRVKPTTELIVQLQRTVTAWGGTVVETRHHPPPGLRRPLVPFAGAASVGTADGVIDAFGIDGFASSRLDGYLLGAGISHLILCGFGLEGPVHSTMRSANDRGYECLLVSDACAPFEPSLVEAAIRTIEMSGGIFGAVAEASAVLAALATEVNVAHVG